MPLIVRRRGASIAVYAAAVGLIALGVTLALDQAGRQSGGLVTRIAGTVNAVDGQLAGNAGPTYDGTPPAAQTVDAHEPLAPMAFTGFSDPEGDPLTFDLIQSGGIAPGELTLTRIPGGAELNGTPSASGTVAVQARDPLGRAAVSPAVQITVAPNTAPTIAQPAGDTEITEGADLTLTYDGVTDDQNDTLTPTLTGLPGATASLSGTRVTVTASAPAPGTYVLDLAVTDDHGLTTHAPSVTLRVVPLTCASLLASDPTASDGAHRVDPDGPGGAAPVDTLCDMADGGWTAVLYASDLPFTNRWNTGDARRWLPQDFEIAWPDAQIAALRARSTQGYQRYVGLCEGVLHRYFAASDNYAHAVRFRLHDGDILDTDPDVDDPRLTSVPQDGCQTNGGEGGTSENATVFDITTLNLPLRNIETQDAGGAPEQFGAPLTTHPAWFK